MGGGKGEEGRGKGNAWCVHVGIPVSEAISLH